jgi:hypothetical protein
MAILDDLAAFRIDPRDPAQVAGALSAIAAAPAARVSLIREWEAATGLVMPQALFDQLQAGAR